MAERIICVAKPARGARERDRCGIELRKVPDLGIPSAPEYGHAARIRWPHWAQPKAVPA